MEQKGARKSQSQRQSVEQPLDVEAVLSGTVAAVEEDPNKEYNRVCIIFSLPQSSHCLTVVGKIMYPILFAGGIGSHTVQSGLSVQRAAGDEVSGQGQPHGEGARRGAHAALR